MPQKYPHISLRLNDADKKRWEAKAEKFGLTLSRLIKLAVEKYQPRGKK